MFPKKEIKGQKQTTAKHVNVNISALKPLCGHHSNNALSPLLWCSSAFCLFVYRVLLMEFCLLIFMEIIEAQWSWAHVQGSTDVSNRSNRNLPGCYLFLVHAQGLFDHTKAVYSFPINKENYCVWEFLLRKKFSVYLDPLWKRNYWIMNCIMLEF